MVKTIIKIDESKCNGCALCVPACQEDAIGIINGKARLLRDNYCDGLGKCLPVCPTGAISFEQRDIDDKAAMENEQPNTAALDHPAAETRPAETQLKQWPVKIKLISSRAPYFRNADLLVAADCAAYIYDGFRDEYMKNRITLIGCPKLDEVSYTEKLTAIFVMNEIKSVTIARMEVPCCSGIENAALTAIRGCGKIIPWQSVTISRDGKIL